MSILLFHCDKKVPKVQNWIILLELKDQSINNGIVISEWNIEEIMMELRD
ncbi:hypothetical protein [Flavobacterium yafengii]|nr:hypothetical protein [Flavobacterium yafengii]MDI6047407.1 hypothetical protein [Flavobacterium yafengii]